MLHPTWTSRLSGGLRWLALAAVLPLVVVIAVRKLAERIGNTNQNLSLLKSGKVKGICFDTLAAICHVLDCQPGDLLGALRPDPAK